MKLKKWMVGLAVSAALAVGVCPAFAFAAPQADDLAAAETLQVQAAPEAIAYSGNKVQFVESDLTTVFGMFMNSGNPITIDYAISDGKLHVEFTPNNRSVYKGFYINAANDDESTWAEENYIAATGSAEEKNFAFDFDLDTKYCGTAVPVAPVKASDGKSTSKQYYLTVPAVEVELAVTNNVSMFKPADKALLTRSSEGSVLVLTMESDSYSNAFVGDAEAAAEASKADVIEFDTEGKTFSIATDELESGEAFVMSFQSASNGNWYERQFTVNTEKKTLTIDPYVAPAKDVFMFRLYNPYTYEHFYTADETERAGLIELGWIDEGVGWTAPGTGTPVYRLYNSYAWDHHYTMDEDEVKALVAEGWEDEGLRWYSDDAKTVPVYREYNPNEYRCNHNYTSDKEEHDGLVTLGWTDEEIGWYGVQNNDEANAAYVDSLIAKIQVQTRTETTDADCAAAKKAWDALSDEQKALVEEADYFGLDTGDASKDDPLNADEIGENEILVVSFGTSFNDSRVADIGGVEAAIAKANPDWSVRRAFTAQIIINHIQARDGEKIDNMDQALARAEANGVKNLVVQPTHLMHGAEYDELVEALEPYQSKMTITVAEPLLGEVGKSATDLNADKKAVAEAAVAAAVEDAGYKSLDAAKADGVAFVFMGHGTEHEAQITYEQMQNQMAELGYENVFIGTVEGLPESTECAKVIDAVKDAGYTKVILRPLMVVAGDHANNDMADPDDEESWYSQFTAATTGKGESKKAAFESVECQIAGLGEIADIQAIYVAHTAAAIAE